MEARWPWAILRYFAWHLNGLVLTRNTITARCCAKRGVATVPRQFCPSVRLSVCLSVRDDDDLWSYSFNNFEHICTYMGPSLSTCAPNIISLVQWWHAEILGGMGVGYGQIKWLSAYKSRNRPMSETRQNTANVAVNCQYYVTHDLSVGGKMHDLEWPLKAVLVLVCYRPSIAYQL